MLCRGSKPRRIFWKDCTIPGRICRKKRISSSLSIMGKALTKQRSIRPLLHWITRRTLPRTLFSVLDLQTAGASHAGGERMECRYAELNLARGCCSRVVASKEETACLFTLRSRGAQLQELVPADPRWSWCNNRNTLNNGCHELESSPNHPQTIPHCWFMEKLASTKLISGAKKVGDHCSS